MPNQIVCVQNDFRSISHPLSDVEANLAKQFNNMLRPRPTKLIPDVFKFNTHNVSTMGARTLLHDPQQNLQHYPDHIQLANGYAMHLSDEVIEYVIGLLNQQLSDENKTTIVFGTNFLTALQSAVGNNLQEYPSVFNKAEACLKKYGFELQFKDITKILIVVHHPGATREGLRPSTMSAREDLAIRSNPLSKSFQVINGHFYVLVLNMKPTVRGRLILEEYDSSIGSFPKRLASASNCLLEYVKSQFSHHNVSFPDIPEFSIDELILDTIVRQCPKQNDWYNCGIHCILWIIQLALGDAVSDTVDAPLIRKKLMAILMTHMNPEKEHDLTSQICESDEGK